jgi:two-component system, chemotaxis family, protein-glutamate methylesterase/glutaminase
VSLAGRSGSGAIRRPAATSARPRKAGADGGFSLIAVGASLGGVNALRTLLSGLPPRFPVPLAIVQHRGADGGSEAMSPLSHLLEARSPVTVREPRDREPIEPGCAYLAPAGYHLLVERGFLTLSLEAPVSFARPSIDVLFESAAEAYGRQLVAVLLTCSSDDGAAGIQAVGRRGGLTIVEDPDSAHSPIAARSALALTRVHHVLPLRRIARVLAGMSGMRPEPEAHGAAG